MKPKTENASTHESMPVVLVIPILNEEQMAWVLKAERALMNAGVTFEARTSPMTDERRWALDWSLEGAYVRPGAPGRPAKKGRFKIKGENSR